MKKMMIMITFITVGYLVMFLTHSAVYKFLRDAFFESNASISRVVGAVFLFLSFSFILVSFWIHYSNTIFSRTAYFLAGLWLGVLLYLFLSAIVYWIALWFSNVSAIQVDKQIVAGLLIATTAIISIFGIWNVYNLKIRTVSVRSDIWPKEWHSKKAVMISDVHLGEVLGLNYLRNLVDKIESLDPDIIFIAGDLFDGMDGAFDGLNPELRRLKARQGIYFVNGNHETYSAKLSLAEVFKGTDIKVLDDELVVVDGVQIIGITYPPVGEHKDVAATIRKIPAYDKDMHSVLLYHIPLKLDEIRDAGINFMLSGHTHRGQLWPFNYITNIMYSGADHGLLRDGDFNIYTSSGAGVWGPTMRTSSRSEIVVLEF